MDCNTSNWTTERCCTDCAARKAATHRSPTSSRIALSRRSRCYVELVDWLRPLILLPLIFSPDIAASQSEFIARSTGFRTPSDNIHCSVQEAGPSDPSSLALRCDLGRITNRPPPKPSDCDLDWGTKFEVGINDARGQLLCAGDTIYDQSMPVLPYGSVWRHSGFVCLSERSGLTCRNQKGRGFVLSRSRQAFF
jgi:Family of unknown function (DUF6636)